MWRCGGNGLMCRFCWYNFVSVEISNFSLSFGRTLSKRFRICTYFRPRHFDADGWCHDDRWFFTALKKDHEETSEFVFFFFLCAYQCRWRLSNCRWRLVGCSGVGYLLWLVGKTSFNWMNLVGSLVAVIAWWSDCRFDEIYISEFRWKYIFLWWTLVNFTELFSVSVRNVGCYDGAPTWAFKMANVGYWNRFADRVVLGEILTST